MCSFKRSAKAVVSLFIAFVVMMGMASQTLAAAFLDTVIVDNIGNANDPADGDTNTAGTQNFGAVANSYQMGAYEVTNNQYAAFLNAVAVTDTNSLYNGAMGGNASLRGGITRSGASGSYSYAPKPDMGNKPVNFVSWYDAARFANWMTNGRPTGPQSNGTTEDGAYTLTALAISTNTVVRNPGDIWAIPTENEWYKSAYYNPSTGTYFTNPTSSNSTPTLAGAIDTAGPTRGDISNPGTNVANYNNGADWNLQNGNVTTVGSAGSGSASPYLTFDQGGNVQEWNEATPTASTRGIRGGSWSNPDSNLRSFSRTFSTPSTEANNIGFRLTFIPEPASLSLLGLVSVMGLRRRDRN